MRCSVLAGFAVMLMVGVNAVAGGGPAAAADPIIVTGKALASAHSPDGSTISALTIGDDRHLMIEIRSAAMDRTITVAVQRPADTSAPRPVLYLLDGAGGGLDAASWADHTEVVRFLGQVDANIVTPLGGSFSYYTDWIKPHPIVGPRKWKTFLAEELPPLIDAALGSNGMNAIVGRSMSATSVLQLVEANPGLYRSAAALSGCAQISDPIGYQFVKLVIGLVGDNPDDMYGPPNDPMWLANDPYVHADKLRGTRLFISSGDGTAAGDAPKLGSNLPSGPDEPPTITGAVTDIAGAVGRSSVEAATNWCSHNLQARLGQLGVPATYHFVSGSHDWTTWSDALKAAWPTLAAGLGLPA